MKEQLKVLVFGATGGSGRAVVRNLLAEGHQVTAFARRSADFGSADVRVHCGDVLNRGDVDEAVVGHDAVVVALGISENPLRVRLFGSGSTALTVRSAGTQNVIESMKANNVQRLVVMSSYGVGPSRDRLVFLERVMFRLLLAPQIADTELQEREVRASGLDWVLAQPVTLTDEDGDLMPFVSTEGEVRGRKVSRNSVGRFLASAAAEQGYVGRTVALSGAAA